MLKRSVKNTDSHTIYQLDESTKEKINVCQKFKKAKQFQEVKPSQLEGTVDAPLEFFSSEIAFKFCTDYGIFLRNFWLKIAGSFQVTEL